MQGDEQALIAYAQQRLADQRIALGHIDLGLHRVDQPVEPGIAELGPVEVAVRPARLGARHRLQGVLRVIGGHAPAQHVKRRLELLEGQAVLSHRRGHQPHLHTQLGPHRHHRLADLLVIDIAVVRTVHRQLEAFWIAGLRHQPSGFLDVGLQRDVDVRRVAVDTGCHHDAGGNGQAAHDGAPDRLAVDGHAQGFTHAPVLERVLALDVRAAQLIAALVHRKENRPHLRAFDNLQFRVGLQLGHVLGRQVGEQIDIARQQGGDAGRVGLDRQIADFGHIAGARLVPPVRVGDHRDLLVGLPAGDLVGPGAHCIAGGIVVIPGLVILRVGGLVFLSPGPAHDAEIDDVAQQDRVRCVQHHVDGVIVDLLDLLDAGHVDLHRALRLADAAQGEDHVVGGEGRAVLELDPFAQLEADLGRADVSPFGRQRRLDLVAGAVTGQAFIRMHQDGDGRRMVLRMRVHGQDVVLCGPAQRDGVGTQTQR